MFKVYLENECFYDDRIDEKYISDMKLTLEENKAGSFEFVVYPQHPYYQSFDRMKSIITVTQNDKIIFRGRVLDSEESFYKERKFTCEGEFAFLNDSVIHPDGYEDDEGTTSATPIEIFTKIISDHNSQVTEERQFIIGTISVDGSDKEVSYAYMEWEKSLDAMEDLLEAYGGHISFRHEDEGTYIDWIDSYELLDQTAELGKNILDLTQTVEGGEIITGILPTGEENENTGYPTNISEMAIRETEHHKQILPITSSDMNLENSFPINGKLNMGNIFGEFGLVIVNKPLYEKYGAIIEQRSYDGYPADWIQQVLDEVDALTGLSNSIEVTIVDLGWLENDDFLEMGKKIKVISAPHGVNDTYSILKLELDLQKPESNKVTLNKTISNFIDQVVNPDGSRPVGDKGNSAVKYSYAYALSDSNTVCPMDSEFSDSIEIDAEKYLWVKVTTLMSDGTSTKSYYCAGKGEGSKFEIVASSGVVVRNDRLTTSQTITFRADINGYTKARPKWYVNDRYVAEGGTYTTTIPYRNAEGFTISLFNGTQLMDTLNIDVLDKTADPLYLGAYDNAVPTQGYDDEGNALIIAVGDYFLCSKSFDTFKAGNPYRWNGTSWEEVYVTGDNANVAPDMYGKIMSSCLDDAINSDTVQNTKFMSWFKRLATKEAFVENLFAQIITVLGEFLFTKRIGSNLATLRINQSGLTMQYGVASDGDSRPICFSVDFSTGNIFFGRPNAANSAPEYGFMYRGSDKSIRSKNNNVIIYEDGTLIAQNADISGTINATDGAFKGVLQGATGVFNGALDTPSFSAMPNGSEPVETTVSGSAETQYNLLYSFYQTNSLTQKFMYRCEHSLDPSIKYIIGYDTQGSFHNWRFEFYGEDGTTMLGLVRRYDDFWIWIRHWSSTWANQTFTVTVYIGDGNIFKFKSIPSEPLGLEVGQVWADSTGILHVVQEEAEEEETQALSSTESDEVSESVKD